MEDLKRIKINTDKEESSFVEYLAEGGFDVRKEGCCDEIWRIFTEMAQRRAGGKNRKTFFGWFFRSSSFLDAYNKAKKETNNIEKVKYMLNYKKYSDESVMRGVPSFDRIVELREEKEQREFENKMRETTYTGPTGVYEKELHEISGQDWIGLRKILKKSYDYAPLISVIDKGGRPS